MGYADVELPLKLFHCGEITKESLGQRVNKRASDSKVSSLVNPLRRWETGGPVPLLQFFIQSGTESAAPNHYRFFLKEACSIDGSKENLPDKNRVHIRW